MQLEAVYNRGRLRFTQPVRLAQDCFPVYVELPDDAVITNDNLIEDNTTTLRPHIRAMFDEIKSILDAPVADDECPVLTEKQERRIEAFELRKNWRQEQGHSA